MRRFALLAVVALIAAPAAHAGQRDRTRSTAVQDWVGVALDEIAAHRTNPPRASRVLAHLSVATYAAAALGGSNRDEVITGAAAEVLGFMYPDRVAYFDSLAGGGGAVAAGRAFGRLLVYRAQHDGADAVWTGTPPTEPGTWVPTPPAFTFPPLEPLAGTWRTWNLSSGSQFRPGPPPPLGSTSCRAELQQVYDASRTLTPRQREAGSLARLRRDAVALTGASACARGLAFAVARLRRRHELVQQARRRLSNYVDRTGEGSFVRLRRLREAADLAHVLQRGGPDLLIGRRRVVVVEGVDVATHDDLS